MQVHDGGSGDLIPILQREQGEHGYISEDSVRRISRSLRISESEIYGVATFYTQFRFTPPGEHVIRVCLGTACHVKGGAQILDTVQRRLVIQPGETTADRKFQLERVACVGCCALAPVVAIDDKVHAQMSVLRVQELVPKQEDHAAP